MRKQNLLLGLLPIALLATGCRERTEVLLGFLTDLTARDKIDQVRLIAQRDGVEVIRHDWDLSGRAGEPFELPGSFGIFTTDGSAPQVRADLIGFQNGKEFVRRTSIFTLVSEKTLFMRMALVNSCSNRMDCAADQNCVEGRCVPRLWESSRFPVYAADMEKTVQCKGMGGATYINTSTKKVLDLIGGGVCNGACIEATCYPRLPWDEGGRALRILDVDPKLGPTTGGIPIKVIGQNFTPGMTVTFGGKVAPRAAMTRVLDSMTEVFVTLPKNPGLQGKVEIKVSDEGVGSASNNELFSYFPTTLRFDMATNVIAGLGPSALAVADFDRDGKLDVIAANTRLSVAPVLYLGMGAGKFAAGKPLPCATQCSDTFRGMIAADLNADGKIDLAYLGSRGSAQGLVVHLQDSQAGTFRREAFLSLTGVPSDFTLGDFDDDKRLDLAVSDAQGTAVRLFFTQADGSFRQGSINGTFSTGDAITSLDYDTDGILDLAVAHAGRRAVSLVRNMGKGVFVIDAKTLATGMLAATDLEATDLDGDGDDDLILVHQGGVAVMPNLSEAFGSPVLSETIQNGSFTSMLVADVDGDGLQDVVLTDTKPVTGSVHILRGTGKAAYSKSMPLMPALVGASGVALGDLTGEGRPDFFVSLSSSAPVLLQNASE